MIKHHEPKFGVLNIKIDQFMIYEDMFDCKFPFSKYDIIYCPEFRIGAMENVGAVTFADVMLKAIPERT